MKTSTTLKSNYLNKENLRKKSVPRGSDLGVEKGASVRIVYINNNAFPFLQLLDFSPLLQPLPPAALAEELHCVSLQGLPSNDPVALCSDPAGPHPESATVSARGCQQTPQSPRRPSAEFPAARAPTPAPGPSCALRPCQTPAGQPCTQTGPGTPSALNLRCLESGLCYLLVSELGQVA